MRLSSWPVGLLIAALLAIAALPAISRAQPAPGSGASPPEALQLANRFNGIIEQLKRALRGRRTDVAGVNAVFGRQPVALHRAAVGAMRASLSAYPQTREGHRAWLSAYGSVTRILGTGLTSAEYMLGPVKGSPGSFYPEIARLRAEMTAFQLDRAHHFAGGKANVLRLLAQAPTGIDAFRTANRLYENIAQSDWPADVQDLVRRRQRAQMAAAEAASAAAEAKSREQEYGGIKEPLRRLWMERRLKNEHALFHILDRQYARVAAPNPYRSMGGAIFDPSGRSDMNRHLRQHLRALGIICPGAISAIGVLDMPQDDWFSLKEGRIVGVFPTASIQAAVADAQAYVSVMGCGNAPGWAKVLKGYLDWNGR